MKFHQSVLDIAIIFLCLAIYCMRSAPVDEYLRSHYSPLPFIMVLDGYHTKRNELEPVCFTNDLHLLPSKSGRRLDYLPRRSSEDTKVENQLAMTLLSPSAIYSPRELRHPLSLGNAPLINTTIFPVLSHDFSALIPLPSKHSSFGSSFSHALMHDSDKLETIIGDFLADRALMSKKKKIQEKVYYWISNERAHNYGNVLHERLRTLPVFMEDVFNVTSSFSSCFSASAAVYSSYTFDGDRTGFLPSVLMAVAVLTVVAVFFNSPGEAAADIALNHVGGSPRRKNISYYMSSNNPLNGRILGALHRSNENSLLKPSSSLRRWKGYDYDATQPRSEKRVLKSFDGYFNDGSIQRNDSSSRRFLSNNINYSSLLPRRRKPADCSNVGLFCRSTPNPQQDSAGGRDTPRMAWNSLCFGALNDRNCEGKTSGSLKPLFSLNRNSKKFFIESSPYKALKRTTNVNSDIAKVASRKVSTFGMQNMTNFLANRDDQHTGKCFASASCSNDSFVNVKLSNCNFQQLLSHLKNISLALTPMQNMESPSSMKRVDSPHVDNVVLQHDHSLSQLLFPHHIFKGKRFLTISSGRNKPSQSSFYKTSIWRSYLNSKIFSASKLSPLSSAFLSLPGHCDFFAARKPLIKPLSEMLKSLFQGTASMGAPLHHRRMKGYGLWKSPPVVFSKMESKTGTPAIVNRSCTKEEEGSDKDIFSGGTDLYVRSAIDSSKFGVPTSPNDTFIIKNVETCEEIAATPSTSQLSLPHTDMHSYLFDGHSPSSPTFKTSRLGLTPSEAATLKLELSDKRYAVHESLKTAVRSYAPPCEAFTSLAKAIQYTLLAKSKRFRPILCLMSCELFDGDPALCMPTAAAIEMIHSMSLIHDDLPIIDNDSMRRGQPTNHVIFGQPIALLAGDALLALAFEHVTKHSAGISPAVIVEVVRLLAEGSGLNGIAGGQAGDMQATNYVDSMTLEHLEWIHTYKTGSLLRVAAATGALLANAPKEEITNIKKFANLIGLAFQVLDDILDVTQNSETLGKTAGKDARTKKLTFPLLIGLENSKLYAESLIEEAIEILKPYGARANRLITLAKYVYLRSG